MLWGLAVFYIGWSTLVGFWATAVDVPVSALVSNALRAMYAVGVPEFINYYLVEFLANVAFFVPIGALLTALLPRRLCWAALVGSALFSLAIELGQLLFLPGRYASLGDVSANSIGGAIGVATIVALRLAVNRRRTVHQS